MRILIDESLPRPIKKELTAHSAVTVPEMGWASKKNGELLALMIGEFDVFITADQNLEYQQNLSDIQVAIVVLAARSTRLDDLLPLMPQVLMALESIEAGDYLVIREPDEGAHY